MLAHKLQLVIPGQAAVVTQQLESFLANGGAVGIVGLLGLLFSALRPSPWSEAP